MLPDGVSTNRVRSTTGPRGRHARQRWVYGRERDRARRRGRSGGVLAGRGLVPRLLQRRGGIVSRPAWYETEAELADDLRGAYEGAGELHLPYAEISVIDQAVEKVWQGEGWYRVTDGYGEEWEPDFYVTRECLVADMAGRLRPGARMRPVRRAGPGPQPAPRPLPLIRPGIQTGRPT